MAKLSASIYWKAKNRISYLNSLELSTVYVEVKTEKECQGVIGAETALAVSIQDQESCDHVCPHIWDLDADQDLFSHLGKLVEEGSSACVNPDFC